MQQVVKLPANTTTYLENFNKAPKFYEMEAAQVKAMLAQVPKPQYDFPELKSIKNHTVQVDGGEIRIKVYQPEGVGPFPTVVYLHGGGWVLGAIEATELANRQLVLKSSTIVVSVDYRLSPDVTYPIPVNDSETAVKWVLDHAANLNVDSNSLYIGGDSAGANIAIAVANRLSHQGVKLAGQLLIYPVTNLQFDTDSYSKYSEGFGLDKELMKWFGKHYTGEENDLLKENPEISPLKSDKSLPIRTIIIAAEHDVLVDEGTQYRYKLAEQGIDVEYYLIPGTVHGFYSNVPLFEKETDTVTTLLADFIKKGEAK